MATMKLQAWLKSKKITKADFAERIGVSAGYLTRLANGERQPSLDVALIIARETKGQVPPNAWGIREDAAA